MYRAAKEGTLHSHKNVDTVALRETWWRYCRFPVFLSFLFLSMGVFYAIATLREMLTIKTPSFCDRITTYSLRESCVYPWNELVAMFVLLGTPLVTFTVVGAGTAARYRCIRRQK